jgi:CheY-like chemotaxis protein
MSIPRGGAIRLTLQRRYDPRDGFVFLAAEPRRTSIAWRGRCPVSMARPARSSASRSRGLRRRSSKRPAMPRSRRPTPKPTCRSPTTNRAPHGDGRLFTDAATRSGVDSGHGAIQRLEHEDFDAIVTDWNMDDGSGADIYRWIAQVKPWLAERVVFLADEEGDHAAVVAPGRPMFRKGADSRALTTVLREIVRQVRGEPAPF